MADNGDVVTGSTADSTTVTNLLLDVGDDGTLRDGAEGEDVADGESSVLAGVDELASVHALVGDEGLALLLELVGGVEDNAGERSTTTGVVDDLLHNTTDVAVALGIVERSELSRGLVQPGVGGEDGTAALTLVANLRVEDAWSASTSLPFRAPSLSSAIWGQVLVHPKYPLDSITSKSPNHPLAALGAEFYAIVGFPPLSSSVFEFGNFVTIVSREQLDNEDIGIYLRRDPFCPSYLK